jgi:hypothetical protein
MDWLMQARAAIERVDDWIVRVECRWSDSCASPWTNQDLLGHLSAWSDFLFDQVEALAADRAETIAQVDVDRWNAAQVEWRRGWSPEQSLAEWRRAAHRVTDLGARFATVADGPRRRVAWSSSPVSIADLLGLWLTHIEQHRRRLERP